MFFLGILPDSASIFKTLLVLILVFMAFTLFHTLFRMFLGGDVKRSIEKGRFSSDKPIDFLIGGIFFAEILLLMGLVVNISVYYSQGKDTWVAILFHFVSFCLLGGFVITMDGKTKDTKSEAMSLITIPFIILIFWEWLRESNVFYFLFDLLR